MDGTHIYCMTILLHGWKSMCKINQCSNCFFQLYTRTHTEIYYKHFIDFNFLLLLEKHYICFLGCLKLNL